MNDITPTDPVGARSPVVANPIRTATQLVPAAVITELIDAFITNLNEQQYAALLAGLLLVTSVIQNLLEQRSGIKFLGAKYQLPK